MTLRLMAGAVALAAGIAAGPATGQGAAPATRHGPGDVGPAIFLVRHAETAPDGTRDPALSAAGRERAERLAAMLVDAALDAVYTTDYARTRATAGPVAERLGLTPAVYDPDGLAAFADALASRGGRVLVVGHSNTTPALVAALGGDPGPPIGEAEHSRLYVLVPTDGSRGPIRTVLLRY